jgi:HSP20 family protein
LVDDKEQTLKIVAEMPGVEKTDVKVFVDEDIVHIDAKHGEKDYHVNLKVPKRQY